MTVIKFLVHITKAHYQNLSMRTILEYEKPQRTAIKISFLSKEYEPKDSIIYFNENVLSSKWLAISSVDNDVSSLFLSLSIKNQMYILG